MACGLLLVYPPVMTVIILSRGGLALSLPCDQYVSRWNFIKRERENAVGGGGGHFAHFIPRLSSGGDSSASDWLAGVYLRTADLPILRAAKFMPQIRIGRS
jgi:hypothetical protein